jgi:hypothetical protein
MKDVQICLATEPEDPWRLARFEACGMSSHLPHPDDGSMRKSRGTKASKPIAGEALDVVIELIVGDSAPFAY